ncbi:hypothetical protein [Geminicoccus roseus]|uniref:hypothetical protein n=1 Tax=Geminicoccus roseus TaxID=404900 RepID=UPI0003F8080C|nr:hypothetical protein [Geminicoccus roseus]
MFPYRRNVKKRGKNNSQPRKGAQHSGQGQRIPGSARELLRLLQPTTKALAQFLAGNTRPSGQLSHARHVLEQAQWLVEDRQVERMPPHEREEFLEQFARLKLTIADARELERDMEEAEVAEPRPAKPTVAPERLREMALALSSAKPAPSYPYPAQPEAASAEEPAENPSNPPVAEPEPSEPEIEEPEGEPRSGPRGQRLRLRRTTPLTASVG